MRRARSHRLFATTCLTSAMLVGAAGVSSAYANPTDGLVSSGSAAISSVGSTLTVNQSTDKAVIDWRGFDIGAGETTRFVQPSAASITLNRVTSNAASTINGNLSANGNLILINQNGVVFGSGARVDVNGLVATTANISNDKFMNSSGRLQFDQAGKNPNAVIRNDGTITAAEAGLVGLVAPNVVNTGVITAKLGHVALAAGDTATLDLYGDGLLEIAASDKLTRTVVENSGAIAASGGRIALTAAAGRNLVDGLISNSGALSAQTVSNKNGVITISNAAAGGAVVHSGVIDASNSGGVGGSVTLLADRVTLKGGSRIEASGTGGGGSVEVGGAAHGANAGANAIGRNATTTTVERGATIAADATARGNGGAVVVWSDRYTDYQGSIRAQGGTVLGDGGFAEVSGKQLLNFDGSVNLLAAHGATGTLLLDPYDVTIQNGTSITTSCVMGGCTATGTSSVLTVANLLAALATSNVEVNTGSGGAQTGNITVADTISWSSANRLTLDAYKDIIINSGVTISNTYSGSLTGATLPVLLALRADASGINNGGSVTNNGTIDFSGSTGAISIFTDNASYGGTGFVNNGSVLTNASWAAPTNYSVSNQLTSYQLVNNFTDVNNIYNDLFNGFTYTYALGKNIDAAGAGLTSGGSLGGFLGILDGQYCALSGGGYCGISNVNMTVDPSWITGIGLFGSNSGSIRNLSLNMNITQNYTNNALQIGLGILSGTNAGTIANVTTSGSITLVDAGTGNTSFRIGGITGVNYSAGVITNSSSSTGITVTDQGSVTVGHIYQAGGLVGNMYGAASITNSSATGNLSFISQSTSSVTTTANLGGLVGNIQGSSTASIANSFATGAISNSYYDGTYTGLTDSKFGGLVGSSQTTGTISNSYATGNLTMVVATGGNSYGGGLIGYNNNTILDTVHASGSITTSISGAFGGLVGRLMGASTLSNSYSQTGIVTGINTVGGSSTNSYLMGGLVGQLQDTSSITNSNSSENIVYTYQGTSTGTSTVYIGGLVGYNTSTATNTISGASYATGNVTAQYVSGYTGNVTSMLGGLVGVNGNANSAGAFSGTSGTKIYASGNVTSYLSGGGSNYLGGLVGYDNSSSTISYVSATGNVTYVGGTTANIGGLIGLNLATSTLNQGHYSTGTVSNTYTGGGTGGVSSVAGGLIGYNAGAISNSDVLNATVVGISKITAGTGTNLHYLGGLVGNQASVGAISNSNTNATVTYSYQGLSSGVSSAYAGGLIGRNYSTATNTISGTSYATGDVTAGYGTGYSGSVNSYLGGLVGQTGNNNSSGAFVGTSGINIYATGNVTSTLSGGTEYVGGLIGYDYSSAALSYLYATGNVTYTGASGAYVGGLIGYQPLSTAALSNVYASGNVSNTYTGTATAAVSAVTGGLIGYVNGSLTGSYSSGGTVTMTHNGAGSFAVASYAGGVIGLLGGSGVTSGLWSSEAVNFFYKGTSTAANKAYLGGLIGQNNSTAATSVASSYATGNVSAAYYNASYSSGNVEADMGGLIGLNGNATATAITTSYATGNVTGSMSTQYSLIGGLVGFNNSTSATSITDSYATSNVSYTGTNTGTNIGGLVGYNKAPATIARVYSTGGVSSSVGNVYGLVGLNAGTINDGYWDTVASGKATGYTGGTVSNVAGKTTTQLQAALQTNFSGTTWGIVAGYSYPYLQWQYPTTPQVLAGYVFTDASRLTAYSSASIRAYVDGTYVGATTASSVNGYYSFLVPGGTISGTGSNVLVYIPSSGSTASGVAFVEGVTGSFNANNYTSGTANYNALSLYNNALSIGAIPGNESAALSGVLTKLAAEQTLSGITGPYTVSGTTLTMTNGASLVVPLTKTGGMTYDVTLTVPHTVNTNANLYLLDYNTSGLTVASANPANGTSWLDSAKVQSFLTAGDNVIVEAIGGLLNVTSNISWSTDSLLSLNAKTNLTNSATLTNTYTGTYGSLQIPVQLMLRADMLGLNNGGSVTNSASGTINFSGSKGGISIYYDRATYGGSYTNSGSITTNAGWTAPTNQTISTQLTSYQLVNTVTDLVAVGSNLSSTFAIGTNILGAYATFNSNTPLGTFTGILDGQYCVLLGSSSCGVTQLKMTASAATTAVGLFGTNSGGKLRSFTFGMDVTQAYTGTSATAVSTVVGNNNGIITGVTATGSLTYSFVNAPSSGAIYIGGLVGANSNGSILNSSSLGGTLTLTSLYNGSTAFNIAMGGLVGDNTTGGVLSGSTSSDTVSYIFKDTNYATATTTNNYWFGGLVGANLGTGTISSSSASGVVMANYFSSTYAASGKTSGSLGGLVGQNANTITSSSASGLVTSSLSNGSQYLGGLVGANTGSSIASSSATGDVSYSSATTTGSVYLGGLMGSHQATAGTVSSSFATGNVTGTYTGLSAIAFYVGGLLGLNNGTVSNSYAQTGAVSGIAQNTAAATVFNMGGLIGSQTGVNATVTGTSYSSESVTYTYQATSSSTNNATIGGLIGYNASTAANSINGSGVSASGAVLAQYASGSTGNVIGYLGGLVGQNGNSTITSFSGAYSSSNVTSYLSGGSEYIGGLIGIFGNSGASTSTVSSAYATGAVTYSGTTGASIGGLIGAITGSLTAIDTSYATGNVSGTYTGTVASTLNIGGLIGNMTSGVAVTNSYTQTGTVQGTAINGAALASIFNMGGLIGTMSGTSTVAGSTASENVTYTDQNAQSVNNIAELGGLIGYNATTGAHSVGTSSASGAVLAQYATGYSGSVTGYIGGLIGLNGASSSTVQIDSNLFASGNVTSYLGGGTQAVGGLIGYNNSTSTITVTGLHASGDVTVTDMSGGNSALVGGLIGSNTAAPWTIDQAYATGNVTLTYGGTSSSVFEGGLIGYASAVTITNSYTQTGAVKAYAQNSGSSAVSMQVGGLVGGLGGGSISGGSRSSEAVTYYYKGTTSGANTAVLGGLVGYNLSGTASSISNVSATGNVTARYYSATYNSGIVNEYLGGLIGQNGNNTTSAVDTATASGTITGYLSGTAHRIGGLIGYGLFSGSLNNASASGDVTYNGASGASIGGLVGTDSNNHTVNLVHASGNVTNLYNGSATATANAGGLFGNSNGSITNSYASGGTINARAENTGSGNITFNIGGLVGYNNTSGSIGSSYSTENSYFTQKASTTGVNQIYMGGLAGKNLSTAANSISDSHASGVVQASYYDATYAYNPTTGVGAAATYMGGLVGQNGNNVAATITGTSFATGAVTDYLGGGSSYVGGLIGDNNSTATLTGLYATGDVTYSGATNGARVGGLIGSNTNASAVIDQAYATGNVTATYDGTPTIGLGFGVGGLAGYNYGTITNSYTQTGEVKTTNIAAGTFNVNFYAGGLVGRNETTGSIGTSRSSENVTYTYKSLGTSTSTTASVGGLVGYNPSTSVSGIASSYATGNVVAQYYDSSYAYNSTTGIGYAAGKIGGLIGQNGNTTATVLTGTNYARGNVTNSLAGAIQNVGGLIGNSSSNVTLTGAYATGDVTYIGLSGAYVGGLIGFISTSVDSSYATGNVSNTYTGTNNTAATYSYTGGLVGGNTGTITNSHASTGSVTATSGNSGTYDVQFQVGGLAGNNSGTITGSYSTENVTYISKTTGLVENSATIGGLVGYMSGTTPPGSIADSYATGNVSGQYFSASYTGNVFARIGGLVGQSGGGSAPTISRSYAIGNVANSLNGSQEATGGLVGLNPLSASIADSYAMGVVSYTGTSSGASTAGLVGYNGSNSSVVGPAYITRTYATGYVTAAAGVTGGLVGSNVSGSTVTDSYWDIGTTGQSTSAGGTETGLSTAALQAGLQTNWPGSGAWSIVAGISYPYLSTQVSGTPQVVSGYSYTDASGASPLASAAVALLKNGSALTSLLTGGSVYSGANGYYYYLVAPNSISGGGSQVMAYLTGSTKGQAFQDTATSSISSLNIYGNALAINSSASSLAGMLTNLATAQGTNSGANFTYTNSGGLTMNSGTTARVNFMGSAGVIDSAITTSGTGGLYLNTSGTVTQSQAITVANLALGGAGGSYTLTNSGNAITTLAANTGTVSFLENSGFDIGAVNGISGLSATNAFLSSAGLVTQSQAISASSLLLNGVSGNYTLTNSGNAIGTLAGNTGTLNLFAGWDLVIGNVAGTDGTTTTGTTTIGTAGTLTLSRMLSANGFGTTLTLNAASIQNSAGAEALNPGTNGRWLVYSVTPSRNNYGGLTGAFERSPCSFGGSCVGLPTNGNGFLYSFILFRDLPNTVQIVSQKPWITMLPGEMDITQAMLSLPVTTDFAPQSGSQKMSNSEKDLEELPTDAKNHTTHQKILRIDLELAKSLDFNRNQIEF